MIDDSMRTRLERYGFIWNFEKIPSKKLCLRGMDSSQIVRIFYQKNYVWEIMGFILEFESSIREYYYQKTMFERYGFISNFENILSKKLCLVVNGFHFGIWVLNSRLFYQKNYAAWELNGFHVKIWNLIWRIFYEKNYAAWELKMVYHVENSNPTGFCL